MMATHVTDFTIRPALATDSGELARIWHEGWQDPHRGRVPDELYQHRDADSYRPRVLSRVSATWVAESGGEVLGFVVVIGDEVEQLYVDKAARGHGAARRLLAQAEELIAAAGHSSAWLAVVDGNDRALAFYAKNGWRDDGAFDYQAEIPGGTVTVPCLRFVKDLPEG